MCIRDSGGGVLLANGDVRHGCVFLASVRLVRASSRRGMPSRYGGGGAADCRATPRALPAGAECADADGPVASTAACASTSRVRWTREFTESLRKIDVRCVLTVCGDTIRAAAADRLVCPAAMSRATLRSEAVSASHPWLGRGRAGRRPEPVTARSSSARTLSASDPAPAWAYAS